MNIFFLILNSSFSQRTMDGKWKKYFKFWKQDMYHVIFKVQGLPAFYILFGKSNIS